VKKKGGARTRDVVHLPTGRLLGAVVVGIFAVAGDGSAPPSSHQPLSPHEKAQAKAKAKPPPPSSRLHSLSLWQPKARPRSGARRMPSRSMSRLSVESASGSGGGGCREAEPVLCAPRPRRAQQQLVHVHPRGADLILGPPPFLLNEVPTTALVPGTEKAILSPSSSPLTSHKHVLFSQSGEEGRCSWAAFGGGSPPARAGNPLVHDPSFLLSQRHPAADPPLELGFFDHLIRTSSYVHRPTPTTSYTSTSSSGSSSKSSFGPSSFAPAVRIQGFDVAACRSSHSGGGGAGGRVLSAARA
jgi:hypothetical protein